MTMGSVDTETSLDNLIKEAQKFDVVRLVWCDIHGIQRGAHVPRSNVASLLQNGVGVTETHILDGPRKEPLRKCPEGVSYDDGNCYMKPVPGTLHPVPWSGEGKYKVGQVICESYWRNGEPQNAYPRLVARQQLQRMKQMGYYLKSAFEVEFGLLDKQTDKFVPDNKDEFSILGMKPFEASFLDLVANMETAGVSIEKINREWYPGCFEVNLPPTLGVAAADKHFIFKAGCKEIMYDKGYIATFMTCPYGMATGVLHHNHSVWDAEGRNLFHDETAQNGLSKTARWWLGGLIKHFPALKAFFCPTFNCYRLRGDSFYSAKSDWAIDNRYVALRIKNDSPAHTFIENRLVTGPANSYIVLAATVAAGLDGIINKIEPPIESDPNAQPLPETLDDAIEALEEDNVLSQALGSEFMDWFLTNKKNIELPMFKSHNVKEKLTQEIQKENEEYLVHI